MSVVKIYVDYRIYSGLSQGYGFLNSGTKIIEPQPERDFYLNVHLLRSTSSLNYVDIQKDEKVFVIERQEINPQFIELGFFHTINRIKINKGADLTPAMISTILIGFPQLSSMTYNEIYQWFDFEGRNLMIKNENARIFPTLDDLEKSDLIWNSVISKANYFPIEINK